MFMYFRYVIIQAIFIICLQAVFSQLAKNYEVTTVLKEKFFDKTGAPLTGKGVVIGDVDSGVDVFHPWFFFTDGGEFNWIDVNGDGVLTFGTDGIDLNGNGTIDSNEILRYLDMANGAWGLLPDSITGKYNNIYDYIYVDANGNKKRDFGPEKGFKETDPGYGEMMFIPAVYNKDNSVKAGEKLIGLKTSKIRTVLQRDGVVRRRGVDMIMCEQDSSGHGTGVAGLIIGGQKENETFHGIAPDAEMVFSCVAYDYTPRFVRNFPDLFNFLKNEQVNIMLLEDGEWMYEFMDNSTPEEEILNEMARNGTTVIGGAGNFTGSDMMIIDTLKSGKEVTYTATAPYMSDWKKNDGVFFSFLWPNTETDISIRLETPENKTVEFNSESGLVTSGKYNIYYAKEVSPKGTKMFRFGCSRKDSAEVKGTWKFTLNSSGDAYLRAYVVDVSQSWSGFSRWKNSTKISDASNICFPSTADSCMAVGAYTVNLGWGANDIIGNICNYSSVGYNIDGKLGIDITAPGHSTISSAKDNSYQLFSGTSSAAPHVVGAAALLLQYDMTLTHSQIKQILHNSALQDNFTGTVPNPVWGYGKLSIENAIKYTINKSN
jgi:subtilase family protein